MKKIVILLILISSVVVSRAQTPNWLWGEAETSGSCYMDTHGVIIGPSGKLYTGGRFNGTMTLGGTSVTSTAALSEVFSGKMDTAGHFTWLTPHPYSNDNDYDYGIGIDKHENTYVTGDIQGSNGLFVDKYDSSGSLVWSFAPPALSSGLSGYGNIGVDDLGNVYVSGGFGGSENFGPATLTAVGNSDIFLTKLDSNGNCKWAVSAGASGQNEGGRGVVVDNKGYLYMCGSYNGTTTFNSVTASAVTLPAVSGDAFFIAKYDTAGNVVWVQTASNAGFNSGAYFWQFDAITIDSCSNVYVAGHFINTAQFGPFTLTNANSNYDMFVAKCLADGNWEWAQSGGGTGNDDAFGIALDKYSDVYVTGYFENTAQFSNQSVTTTAANDVYVAKYANSTGALQWIQVAGGTLATSGGGICVDNQGYVYITGGIATGSGAIFGPSSIGGVTTCGQNLYFAKLDTIPHRTITPTIATTYCPGETTTLPYTIIGTFNSDNNFIAQLSDSSGSFVNDTIIGKDSTSTNGTITITIPSNTKPGSTYLIRVISTDPATSSWANGCGAYFVNNVYTNDFYVTIGGNISVAVSPADTSICSGASVTLNASGGTSYTWSNSDTGSTILVTPVNDTTIYTVQVKNGGCTGSDSVKVIVNPAGAVGLLASSSTICAGESLLLKASGYTNYTWSPDSGLNVTTGDSVIATPTASTTYTITASNASGCSGTALDTVTVVPAPNQPTISQYDDTLKSSAQTNNQWYENGKILNGATGQDLVIGNSIDTFTVVVVNPADGCSSSSLPLITSGINRLSITNNQLSIYPNPTNGSINVNITSSVSDIKDWNLRLTDVLGQTIYTRNSLNYTNEVDLSDLASGVYFVTVTNKTGQGVFKVIKQ